MPRLLYLPVLAALSGVSALAAAPAPEAFGRAGVEAASSVTTISQTSDDMLFGRGSAQPINADPLSGSAATPPAP